MQTHEISSRFSVFSKFCRFSAQAFNPRQLRTENRELRTSLPYQATATAVATTLAIAMGSRNFHPNAMSWS